MTSGPKAVAPVPEPVGKARDEVASPCTRACTMDAATGLCIGCRRTLGEIAAWGSLDAEGRRAILRSLPSRQR